MDELPPVRLEARRLLREIVSFVEEWGNETNSKLFQLPVPPTDRFTESFGDYAGVVESMWPCVPHFWIEVSVRTASGESETIDWELALEEMWRETGVLLMLQFPGDRARLLVEGALASSFGGRFGYRIDENGERVLESLGRALMDHAVEKATEPERMRRPFATVRQPKASSDKAFGYFLQAMRRLGLEYSRPGGPSARSVRRYLKEGVSLEEIEHRYADGQNRQAHRSPDGSVGAGELAQRLGVPKSTMMDFVRRLATKGHAKKHRVGNVDKWCVSPEGLRLATIRFKEYG